MDGNAVQAIITTAGRAEGIHAPTVVEGEGYRYLASEEVDAQGARKYTLATLPAKDIRPKPVVIQTLTGLVDFIKANKDEIPLDKCLVHVCDHTLVQLISRESGDMHVRTLHAQVGFAALIGTPAGLSFDFGRWMRVEDLTIAVQALFADSDDRAAVLELIGTVKNEGVTEFGDDGITQGVVARAGISLGKKVPVPNPVILRPWRTFREVEQPASKFVLRLRGNPGEEPMGVLFEADGGAWKLAAIENIGEYLLGKFHAAGLEGKVVVVA